MAALEDEAAQDQQDQQQGEDQDQDQQQDQQSGPDGTPQVTVDDVTGLLVMAWQLHSSRHRLTTKPFDRTMMTA